MDLHRGEIVRLRIKGSKLLSGDSFGEVAVWDTTTYTCEGLIDAGSGSIQLMDFSEAAMIMTVISKSGVIHIRSLIVLTDHHLLHMEWEPLFKSPKNNFIIDTHGELPPNLAKTPSVVRTKIPPISTITSIAIGGKHPRVLIANADRPSLDGAVRVCPPTSRYSTQRSRQKQQPQQEQKDEYLELVEELEMASLSGIPTENVGIVLTSQVEGISDYLKTCGLKPSFMDVDDDVIVIGTSKGDIVVMSMTPQE
ncbi:hypothetical protein BGZ80_002731 [Entomortierella chlamydospora]|uniref:Uncharacterized protein n=1 Tax=Entomortierella chlamydospora TaxID=101097 RepID=A0A9P6MPG5_9FUNG|nr:hypothetical protein BGZ80_002731 [Entomortierella chlamydospora]